MVQSTKQSPRSRIVYLDLARGLAVFFMVMQHAMILHEQTGGEGASPLANFFLLMGTAPAAPVFLLVMGVFLAQSKADYKTSLKRGLLLFVAGYGLNLLRFTLPLMLTKEPYALHEDPLSMLGLVDIFQVSGLSLILFSGLKKFRLHPWLLPLLALMILLVSPLLWQTRAFFPEINPLWGSGQNVDFPFFPWGVYPLLGMYFSPLLTKAPLTLETKKTMLRISMALVLIGAGSFPFFPIGDYYRSGLSVHFLIAAFTLLWLLVCHALVHRLGLRGPSRLLQLTGFWSQQVTSIYMLQWLIFGWSLLLIGTHQFSAPVATLIGLMVMGLSTQLVRINAVQKWLPKL